MFYGDVAELAIAIPAVGVERREVADRTTKRGDRRRFGPLGDCLLVCQYQPVAWDAVDVEEDEHLGAMADRRGRTRVPRGCKRQLWARREPNLGEAAERRSCRVAHRDA